MIRKDKMTEMISNNYIRLFTIFILLISFISLIDGVLSFLVPILITDDGISNTTMDLIYSSSSLFGIIFDIILSSILQKSSYIKMFIYTVVGVVSFIIIMFTANTVFLFVLGMAVWYFYFNLLNFAIYAFISKETSMADFARTFSIATVIRDIGFVLGPIIGNYLILIDNPFLSMSSLLILSLGTIIAIILISSVNGKRTEEKSNVSLVSECKLKNYVVKILL